jgi:hypothetical protein
MQNVTGALADQMLDVTKKDQLMQAALAEGWDCQGCRPKVFIDLQTFSTCLWKRMDEVISAVSKNVLSRVTRNAISKHQLVARSS